MVLLGKVIAMKHLLWLILRVLARLASLLGTDRTRAVLAENMLLRQQLLVFQRSWHRAPNLRNTDRLFFGFGTLFLDPCRLLRAAVILKPSTLLSFHQGLRDLKYRFLYSSHPSASANTSQCPKAVQRPDGLPGLGRGKSADVAAAVAGCLCVLFSRCSGSRTVSGGAVNVWLGSWG